MTAPEPTEARHYRDCCRACKALGDYSIFIPRSWERRERGFKGRYRCARGHVWSCYWALSEKYFDDCGCPYCLFHLDREQREKSDAR